MNDKPKTWLCPRCGIPGINDVRVPYGESCPARDGCEQPLSINGLYYEARDLKTERGKGISEISNESDGGM